LLSPFFTTEAQRHREKRLRKLNLILRRAIRQSPGPLGLAILFLLCVSVPLC
jgi:hypothetical protein